MRRCRVARAEGWLGYGWYVGIRNVGMRMPDSCSSEWQEVPRCRGRGGKGSAAREAAKDAASHKSKGVHYGFGKDSSCDLLHDRE